MIFGKCEKKSGHPVAMAMLGALAAVGAISAVCVSKKWMCKKGQKMVDCMKDMMKPDDFGCPEE